VTGRIERVERFAVALHRGSRETLLFDECRKQAEEIVAALPGLDRTDVIEISADRQHRAD
jgi:hypothetical protein